jgi:mannose-6-phosphate isomerase-like protein (cupin superfamily)
MEMTREKVLAYFAEHYPGYPVIQLPPENPTEIICEIKRDAQQSAAIAFIKRSQPHMHKRITEIYRVKHGRLKLHVGGQVIELDHDGWVIKPGQVHWAEGDWAKVEVIASPPWHDGDHILVSENPDS